MRILLADDEPRVRFGLRVLLEHQPGWEIVAEAADADELLSRVDELHPDTLLVAWELPGLRSLGSIASLRRLYPGMALIAMSGRPEVGSSALEDGADAFVSKTEPPERVISALKRIGEGESYTLDSHP